jgi:threonine dehydratase
MLRREGHAISGPVKKYSFNITAVKGVKYLVLIHNFIDRMISKETIIRSHDRIRSFVHRTPILSSTTIANKAGCAHLYLKCENLQKVGAFKARGAFNKLLQLDKSVTSVCTHSSGNHAQALAYAATTLKMPSYIVMPQNSPLVKKNGVIGYGGKVIESGNTIKEREEAAERIKNQYGSYFVHPYNDLDIIAGQATAAK